MKTRTIVTIILVALLLSACYRTPASVRGSGRVVAEERAVNGVTGVNLATVGDLIIELGDKEALRVEAEDNLLPYFESDVRSGTLTIRTRQNTSIHTTQPVRYYLTVTGLNAIATTSSGSVIAPALQARTFAATISSSGNVTLASLAADSLAVKLSSSGSLSIGTGQVTAQTITISSSGNYAAGDVRSETADVRSSSSGKATLWVTKRLIAVLSSSGEVRYYGSPQITSTESSSGKLVPLGSR